jgi:hypothetical protein
MASSRANTDEIIWRDDILPRNTKKALVFLSSQDWLRESKWYLAGGTALALQEGHRTSLDLDFFYPDKEFDLEALLGKFQGSDWVADVAREGTVYGRVCNAKVSFIAYPFFIPKESYAWYGLVRVLKPKDIAVMKIVAISQRGKKRDFVDLYWYVKEHEPLGDILSRLPGQYPSVAHNYHHILKSLMYFEDAEQDPMPKIFFNATWREIKKYFEREVPIITKEFLGLS